MSENYMQCEECDGTGVCAICDGEGRAALKELADHKGGCIRCHGDGKCPYCNGTGRDEDCPIESGKDEELLRAAYAIAGYRMVDVVLDPGTQEGGN
jgi:hypothetical protein